MKKAGEYSLNWEEEQITAQLIDFIEKKYSQDKMQNRRT